VKKECTVCTGSYEALLVPFDGSNSSKKALVRACGLSKSDGSEITVLYAIPRYEEMMDFFKTETIKKSLYQEAEKIVEQAKKIAAGYAYRCCRRRKEGHANDKILEIVDVQERTQSSWGPRVARHG
jgi:nucleotide-binding universal stress UspA family protein